MCCRGLYDLTGFYMFFLYVFSSSSKSGLQGQQRRLLSHSSPWPQDLHQLPLEEFLDRLEPWTHWSQVKAVYKSCLYIKYSINHILHISSISLLCVCTYLPYIHTYIHTLHYITLHYITLHYITLHYITLHYIH